MGRIDRNRAIDALRGFSILIVMMSHGVAPIPYIIQATPWASKAIGNGVYGVSIFFVISGFLISSNVIKRFGSLNSVKIDYFYTIRAARILPCIFLFITIYFFLFISKNPDFLPSPPSMFYDGVSSLFELQYSTFYLTGGNRPGMYAFAPLWSLSVEETFYVFFPVVCFFLRSDKAIMCLAVIFVIMGPFMRPYFAQSLLFFGQIDLLSIGCITAKVVSKIHGVRALQRAALPLIAFGVMVLGGCFCLTNTREDTQWALCIIGVATAAILVGASFDSMALKAKNLISILLFPLGFLGRMSLQLYIFHIMIHMLLSPWMGVDLQFTLIVLASWLLENLFLEPVNQKIRAFYWPRGAAGSVMAVKPPLESRNVPVAAALEAKQI
jgi:peptidoglycan/LPS O-acetylase OafA/YrhL